MAKRKKKKEVPYFNIKINQNDPLSPAQVKAIQTLQAEADKRGAIVTNIIFSRI